MTEAPCFCQDARKSAFDNTVARLARSRSSAADGGVVVLFVQIGALSAETQYPRGFQAASIPSG